MSRQVSKINQIFKNIFSTCESEIVEPRVKFRFEPVKFKMVLKIEDILDKVMVDGYRVEVEVIKR